MKKFNRSFTQQQPIDANGIAAAVAVMQSGRLHRYNREANEHTETDLFEQEFARYLGVNNVLACASCGYALAIALKSAGVVAGDAVLCNGWTLSPVPGAIHNAGGEAVLVEMTGDFCIDLDDLAQKAEQSGAKYLMLSHMRGHLVDMTRLMTVAKRYGLFVIEDCAHTMGAQWDGKNSGSFGDIACFSTQTYKHINSGEGGILVTPHNDVMAKAIIYSGSYMFYGEHPAAPELSVFEGLYQQIPNYSGRMDNLRAAILRPQLAEMDVRREAWNARYQVIEQRLRQSKAFNCPVRVGKETYVGSSIQFRLPDFSNEQLQAMVDRCQASGVVLKWFGAAHPQGYTSSYKDWQYLNLAASLPQTEALLATVMDMRIPLTFSLEDCQQIADIIVSQAEQIVKTTKMLDLTNQDKEGGHAGTS